MKNALVPVTKPIVVTPETTRLRVVEVPDTARVEVVVIPVTLRLSMVVPPLKDDIPKTSSKTFGWVLPIPILLVTSSKTKLDAPSTNPALLWNWILLYVPPAPALIVPWLIQVNPPKLFFTKSWVLVPGWLLKS